jgi:hypothetical protein
MPTSVYFNNQNAKTEQLLLEDLIIESIRNHGIDVYYLPRASQSSTDELFGDDPVKTYNTAIKIEVYLETFQDYEGNKEFFSKFGLEVQETARLCIARRTFEKYIMKLFPTTHHTPKEGDLLYLPIQYKLMEIKFVEDEKNFFQLGRDSKNPYMYGLTVEAFKYNGELLNTGVDEIDRIGDVQAFAMNLTMNPGGTGTYTHLEQVYQGASLATATAKGIVAGWDIPSRTLKVRNFYGAFTGNANIIGVKSGATWTLATAPDTMNNANAENIEDNSRIETEADNIIDFTEVNPFGEP